MKTTVLLIALVQMMLAAASSVYPGSTKLPDRVETNPDHAVTYSTPDSFDKVVDYYKKIGKVTNHGSGVAEFNLDSGEGGLVRDMDSLGRVIVLVPAKKK
jgi:hypothetical protein